MGVVDGRTPQEFLTYIFDIGGEQLKFVVYANQIKSEIQTLTTIWPLEGIYLELFNRKVQTVTLLK